MMKICRIPSLQSTNTFLKEHAGDYDSLTMLLADSQTSGRGQRGNSWEAEPGKNLTFSVLWRPEGFPARRQFAISEAVALAVVDLLRELGVAATVKWPNDIYVGSRKICGILIEHSLSGSEVGFSILGVGLNVNQSRFVSDAPNPVSVIQLTGSETLLEPLARRMGEILERRLARIADEEGRGKVHEEFKRNCYRMDGALHPFLDKEGKPFEAEIHDIEPEGFIILKNGDSVIGKFAFKEIAFVI